MSAPELLPCPFCGAEQPPHDDTSWIRCGECGAETGWQATGAEAIAAWNRRAASPEVQALIAAAEARGWDAAIEAGAALAHPPQWDRKGKPGLWRLRRAKISADISALQKEP